MKGMLREKIDLHRSSNNTWAIVHDFWVVSIRSNGKFVLLGEDLVGEVLVFAEVEMELERWRSNNVLNGDVSQMLQDWLILWGDDFGDLGNTLQSVKPKVWNASDLVSSNWDGVVELLNKKNLKL